MATIAGAKPLHLLPTLEHSWYVHVHGEVHTALAAAADCEAT